MMSHPYLLFVCDAFGRQPEQTFLFFKLALKSLFLPVGVCFSEFPGGQTTLTVHYSAWQLTVATWPPRRRLFWKRYLGTRFIFLLFQCFSGMIAHPVWLVSVSFPGRA